MRYGCVDNREEYLSRMKIRKAALIALSTFDGLWEMKDHIPLGQQYLIDTDSVTSILAFNIEQVVFHARPMIRAKDGEEWNWLPLELLKIEET